jgi:hypothetical protein
MKTDEQCVGKDLEGNGLSLIKAIYKNFPGGTEKITKHLSQDRCPD